MVGCRFEGWGSFLVLFFFVLGHPRTSRGGRLLFLSREKSPAEGLKHGAGRQHADGLQLRRPPEHI